MTYNILAGDVLEQTKLLPTNHFDGILSDPPYGISFMGKGWDCGLPSIEVFSELLRVCKPGAYALIWGGTRTQHRMICHAEDAGWIVRTSLIWLHGQGFPHGNNVSISIDKMLGFEREIIAPNPHPRKNRKTYCGVENGCSYNTPCNITLPSSDQAKLWDGYNTSIKPAHEVIALLQKSLDGTYAENCLKWRCGALNINSCRVGSENITVNRHSGYNSNSLVESTKGKWGGKSEIVSGRYPPDVLLQHLEGCEVVGEKEESFNHGDAASDSVARGHYNNRPLTTTTTTTTNLIYNCVDGCPVKTLNEQSSGASRFFPTFFYHAKPSSRERNLGCEELEEKVKIFNGQSYESSSKMCPVEERFTTKCKNVHPTLKSIEVNKWLATLIMPPESRNLLVPYCGSGSEMISALLAGFNDVTGIELSEDYIKIAKARLKYWTTSESD